MPNIVLKGLKRKEESAPCRSPLHARHRGSTDFPNQNLRQICQGGLELCLDKQTDKQAEITLAKVPNTYFDKVVIFSEHSVK